MKRLLAAAASVAIGAPGLADPAIHYAPAENLEHLDVALIDSARQEIDLAAYVLTDWPVIEALTPAADRGVIIRIYLDGTCRPRAGKALSRTSPKRLPSKSASSATAAPQCT